MKAQLTARISARTIALLASTTVLTSVASAQFTGIYVDVGAAGNPAGLAPPAYGAANGDPTGANSIPGEWNLFDPLLVPNGGTSQALVNGDGGQTAVTMTWDTAGAPLLAGFFDQYASVGPDGNLLDDYGRVNGPSEIRFDNLPAGSYEVITYAFGADSAMNLTSVELVGGADGVQTIGSNLYYFLAEPGTLSRDITTLVAGSSLTIRLDVAMGADSVNGLQITPLDGDIPAGGAPVGMSYCTANPNTTGVISALTGEGSADVADNDVTLVASDLPANVFGFFLASQTQGFVLNPGGSSGNLCLSGAIGRYTGSGQIFNSGPDGTSSLTIDLTMIPQPVGTVAAMSGGTFNFQAWHRDVGVGSSASNLTNGLQIDFQ